MIQPIDSPCSGGAGGPQLPAGAVTSVVIAGMSADDFMRHTFKVIDLYRLHEPERLKTLLNSGHGGALIKLRATIRVVSSGSTYVRSSDTNCVACVNLWIMLMVNELTRNPDMQSDCIELFVGGKWRKLVVIERMGKEKPDVKGSN